VSPKPRNSQPAVTVHHAQLEDDVVHFPWPQWRHRRNPIDGGKMHGRDGILAHSYMLGLNGQSNGCVSFNDYAAFLDALCAATSIASSWSSISRTRLPIRRRIVAGHERR
jgi:hypothetical protein